MANITSDDGKGALYALIDEEADKLNIPRSLARALFMQESGMNPGAVNPETGATGIGQLMPATASGLGVTDRTDPAQAIPASLKYLREGLDATGNTRDGLHYYYGGPDRAKWGPKTRAYPDQVLRHVPAEERATKRAEKADEEPDLYQQFGVDPNAKGKEEPDLYQEFGVDPNPPQGAAFGFHPQLQRTKPTGSVTDSLPPGEPVTGSKPLVMPSFASQAPISSSQLAADQIALEAARAKAAPAEAARAAAQAEFDASIPSPDTIGMDPEQAAMAKAASEFAFREAGRMAQAAAVPEPPRPGPTLERLAAIKPQAVARKADIELPDAEGSGVLRRVVGDTAVSATKGAIGLPEAYIGITDLYTGGAVGRVAERAGFRAKEAKAALDEMLTPEQRMANASLENASGFADTIITAINKPSTIYHAAVESAPSMLGSAAMARKLMAMAPRMPAILAAAAGEGAFAAGSAAEQIRQETKDGLLTGQQVALATGSGVLTALLGAIGGKVAKRLGIADIDTALASGRLSAAIDAGDATAKKAFAMRVIQGAIAEGVLEEMPQSAQEQIAQNIALGRPWAQGVDKAAAMGFLVGAVMGGGMAAVQGDGKTPEERAADAARASAMDAWANRGLTQGLKSAAPPAGPASPPPAAAQPPEEPHPLATPIFTEEQADQAMRNFADQAKQDDDAVKFAPPPPQAVELAKGHREAIKRAVELTKESGQQHRARLMSGQWVVVNEEAENAPSLEVPDQPGADDALGERVQPAAAQQEEAPQAPAAATGQPETGQEPVTATIDAPAAEDFVLSGSNRAVDQARARGQMELAPSAPSEYDAALSSFKEASERFRQAQSDYRSMKLSDQEFLAAKEEFFAAEKAMDNAESMANGRKKAVAAPRAIEDFGEKIGGARKDTATDLGKRVKVDAQDDGSPAWRKRYITMDVLETGRVDQPNVGKWFVMDKRTGDPMKDGWRPKFFDSEADAEKAIPLLAVAQKHRVVQASGDNAYEIWRTVTDRKRVKVVDQQFESREDAMRYMATNAAQILEVKTSFGEEVLARPEKVVRRGVERRNAPATKEMFEETFGFRGVEFGLWNSQDERQEVMNHAFDGLLDLAEIINVPPKALSLNGDLALAFGSRGHGIHGARAHYEHDYGVINLTKMEGAGALAHEWFHALDHYFRRQDMPQMDVKEKNERGDMVYPRGKGKPLATHGFAMRDGKIRPEVKAAIERLVKGIFTKAEKFVEDTQKAEKFVGGARNRLAESLNSIRDDLLRGPEQLTWMKRNNKPATTPQLAAFDALAARLIEGQDLKTDVWKATEAKPGKRVTGFGGRLTNATVEEISEIYKAVRGRSGFTPEKSGVMDGLIVNIRHYSERAKMLEEASAGTQKEKRVPTAFAMDAKRIDQGRASDYWTTEHEMAARAFSAYVEDKLAAMGNESDFLSYGSNNALPTYRLLNMRPFPEGAEREAINGMFDDLFSTIKTKETDKGVAMFSRGQDDRVSLADFWIGYAKRENSAQHGRSDSPDIAQIAKDYRLDESRWKVNSVKRSQRVSSIDTEMVDVIDIDALDAAGNFTRYLEIHPDPAGDPMAVFIRINEIGSWPKKMDGALAYQIGMAWAVNNGLKLNPDTDLLPVNRLRRSEAMISTMLKYGEKAGGIRPHREQFVGLLDESDWNAIQRGGQDGGSANFPKDVTAKLDKLRASLWTNPDSGRNSQEKSDIFRRNLENLLVASSELALRRVPALSELRVGDAGEVENAITGERIGLRGTEDLGGVVVPSVAMETGVGRTTGLRVVATLSLGSGVHPRASEILDGKYPVERQPDAKGRVAVLEASLGRGFSADAGQAGKIAAALGQKALYSRTKDAPARGLSVSAARAAAVSVWGEKAVAALEQAGLFNLHGDHTGFPSNWGARSGDYGAYWRGAAHFNSSAHQDAQHFLSTVLHELGEHHGLKAMVGEETYVKLGQRIRSMHMAGNKAVVAAWDDVAGTVDVTSGRMKVGSEAFLSEVLARVGQAQEIRRTNWWRDLVDRVRAFMLKTWGIKNIDEAGIQTLVRAALARSMRDAVARQGKSAKATAKALEGEPVFHRAYHGTPHDFDRFSTEKIGTGEGAQAYGWGLYFSGKREVAEWYKEKLSGHRNGIGSVTITKDGSKLTGDEILGEYYKPGVVLRTPGGSYDKVLSFDQKQLYVRVTRYHDEATTRPEFGNTRPITYGVAYWTPHDIRTTLIPEMEKRGWKNVAGRLYEVELAPKEEDYLDWDKPLSEQSKRVRGILNSLDMSKRNFRWEAGDFGGFILYDGAEKVAIIEPSESGGNGWDVLVARDDSAPDFFEVEESGLNESAARKSAERLAGTRNRSENPRGQEIYRRILGSAGIPEGAKAALALGEYDKAASLYLKSIGIPGIRYLDGSSRRAGEGHHNYVIFDEADVSVVAKFNRARNDGEEYESRLFGGAYSAAILKRAHRDAPIRKIIAQARERYNALRVSAGLAPVSDWSTRPDRLLVEGPQFSRAQVSTPAFKAWFRDSKVVDANGEPLVVYHGTNKDIWTFKPGGGGGAIWFAADADLANLFVAGGRRNMAEKAAKGSAVYPVYLSAQRLLDLGSASPGDTMSLSYVLRKAGLPDDDSALAIIAAANLKSGYAFVSPEVGNAIAYLTRQYRSGTRASYVLDDHGLIAALRAAGFDGIKMREERSDTYAVFRPEQIKSAVGNNWDFDPQNPDIRFSRAPLWGSALKAAVEGMTLNAAPAKQWQQAIANLTAKGVKKDEIEWSGVTDWLGLQDGKVTKQAVIDYIEANGVQVKETVLGAGGDSGLKSDSLKVDLDAAGYDIVNIEGMAEGGAFESFYVFGLHHRASGVVYSDSPDAKGWADTFGRVKEVKPVSALPRDVGAMFSDYGYALESEQDPYERRNSDDTRYSQYTLPGGENYREVLLTIPVRQAFLTGEESAEYVDLNSMRIADQSPEQNKRWNALRDKIESAEKSSFRSSHFDTTNIVAHLRVNDRKDADGKRILFIEEIQSDWAQQGNRKGFGAPEKFVPTVGVNERDNLISLMRKRAQDKAIRSGADALDAKHLANRMGHADLAAVSGIQEEYDDLVAREQADIVAERRSKRPGTPAAPFVTKTEAWVALAVKRAIRMAVDGGYDGIAWTTGEQQADRYDLSKQVDNVRAEKYGQDNYSIQVRKGGEAVLSEHDIGKARIADLLGKDLAEKISAIERGTGKVFSGLDLKVGGEGMVTFYDKIVPGVVRDVLKKLGGGGVETVGIEDRTKEMPSKMNAWTLEETWPTQDQPGFYLPPDMREKASGPMPMFSRKSVKAEKRAKLEKVEPNSSADRVGKLADGRRAITELIADHLNSDKSLNFWHKTVGTPFHLAHAKKSDGSLANPDFKRVYDAGQEYLREMASAAITSADLAPSILPKMEGLKGAVKSVFGAASQKDIAAASRAIFDGTADNPHKGVVFSDAELVERFKLTPRQITLYREGRAAIDHSLDLMLAGEVARKVRNMDIQKEVMAAVRRNPSMAGYIVGDELADRANRIDKKQSELLKGDGNGEQLLALEREKRALMDLATDLGEAQDTVESLKAHGYAPLQRFGSHTVAGYDMSEPDKPVLVYYSMHESQSEANAAKRTAKRFLEDKYPDSPIVVESAIKKEKGAMLYRGLTPDSLDIFARTLGLGQDPVYQTMLKAAVNSRSALMRMVHRKGVSGYEEDLPRVLASFITSNARRVATNWHMGELVEAAEKIRRGDVADYAIELVDFLQNPKEAASWLRSYLFINYLGGSIASAMVNMTQPLTMTFPYLSQWGAKRAVAELTHAMLDSLPGVEPADRDLLAALKRGEDEGIVAPQEIHMLHAEAMRNMGSNLWVRRGITAWGALFSAAEAFNRRVSFIAAYRVGKADGVKDVYAFARKAVEETQGVYNRGNRPAWARSAIGATLFTFKQYSVSYLEFLKRLPPQGRALALLVIFLLAGTRGLPFAEDAMDILDAIAQKLGYSFNSREALRKFVTGMIGQAAGNAALVGVSHFTPLDIQGRMGMGNLIPGTAALKQSTEGWREAVEVLGPAGSLGQAVVEALRSPNTWEASKKAWPVALQNIDKGMDMWNAGMYKDSRGNKVKDVTKGESMLKAIGFQPASVAAESRLVSEQLQDIGLHKKREAAIVQDWAQGLVERRIATTPAQSAAADEKVDRARNDLADWNSKNPDKRIVIKPEQVRDRAKEMLRDRNQRIIKRAPPELRKSVRDGLED